MPIVSGLSVSWEGGGPAGRLLALGLAAAALAAPSPGTAHPHVFVDGGVDFVIEEGGVLAALEVTWLFDPFETLYTLSLEGLAPNADGVLDEAGRRTLTAIMSDWSEDFDGSAHLSVDGAPIALEPPIDFATRLVDGRLETTFARRLAAPLDLGETPAEVAFYEATYYYAFYVANEPRLLGEAGDCSARVIPFDIDAHLAELQTTLYDLGREETPEIENVGALFADRILLRCAS